MKASQMKPLLMKKISLSIPKPCHENWDAMTQQDKGKFCGSCQKNVIDFSTMSDRQIADFFKKPAGNVCGRFGGDQLNRVIEVPRKRIPWIKYFFTIAIPAALFSNKAAAQGQVRLEKVAVCEKPVIKGDTVLLPAQDVKTKKIISGKVVDQTGLPIAAASVVFEKTKRGVITNHFGKFKIEKQNEDEKELIISSIGFDIQTIDVSKRDSILVTLSYSVQGEVVVGVVVRKKPPVVPSMKLIDSPKMDTAFSKFSIFPNPVAHNSSFTIEIKDLEDGRYNMAIITSTGEVVQTKEVLIEKKIKRLGIQLENVTPGPYFIRLTNKQNNKAYTEIILVQ